MDLPEAFCWTKYGDEAGESVPTILHRKEAERVANGGLFLWGIGTSIRPSLVKLLAEVPGPEVIFSPMLSAPAAKDACPPVVVVWRHAHGIDGKPFKLPAATTVISRLGAGARSTRHYALVCESSAAIAGHADGDVGAWIDDSNLRNFVTGRPLGASQVTSVVKVTTGRGSARSRYRVGFRAALRYPYLVELSGHRTLFDSRP